MPTYTYRCNKCGTISDHIFKIADRDNAIGEKCERCDGTLEREVTVVAFGDPVRMGLSGKRGDMKEVLQRIHSRTPGSILDQTSQINKI